MSNIYVDKLNEAITVLGGEPVTAPAGNVYVAKLDEVIASLTALYLGYTPMPTFDLSDIFNNAGNPHIQNTDFNALPDTYSAHYVGQGYGTTTVANGPPIPGATQFYGFTIGQGTPHRPSSYSSQLYWPRSSVGGNPYLSMRFRENGTWTEWRRIYAGYADSAPWAGITSTPTTLAGYAITDAAASTHTHTGVYQPLDEALTALSGVTWAAGTQVLTLTAADTITLKTVGAATGNILDKASGDALYSVLAHTHTGVYSPVAGSTSITTLGTITAGAWTGTTIAVANGGTGATTAAAALTALGASASTHTHTGVYQPLDGDLVVAGKLNVDGAVGLGAAPVNYAQLYVYRNTTAAAIYEYGMVSASTITGTYPNQNTYGIQFSHSFYSPTVAVTDVYSRQAAMRANMYNYAVAAVTNVDGANYDVRNVGGGNIAAMNGLAVMASRNPAPSGGSAGVITRNVGLYLQQQTVGVTNWQIYSDGGNVCFNAGALLVGKTTGLTSAGAVDVAGALNSDGGFKKSGTAGISATVTLAKLTTGGANGSMTIAGGIVTAYTAPT